jgi:N-acetylneuraminic acid mutarotase
MLNYTLLTANVSNISPRDGAIGFKIGTDLYIAFGWISPTTTYNDVYRSTDNGASWTRIADFPYFNSHTVANAMKENELYIVGGDIYNDPKINGSYKFNGTAWTEISTNCGLQNRILGELVYHNNAFYYWGGQTSLSATSITNTILKSTDNCLTFTVANSNTLPYFKGGLHLGAVVSWKGYMWKFGGSTYDNSGSRRDNNTSIYRTTDGVTFEYMGEMPMCGRHYHKCIVVNDKVYVLNGVNVYYGLNLKDAWSIDFVNNKLVFQDEGLTTYSDRHAHSVWTSGNEIFVFGGSNDANQALNDLWKININ